MRGTESDRLLLIYNPEDERFKELQDFIKENKLEEHIQTAAVTEFGRSELRIGRWERKEGTFDIIQFLTEKFLQGDTAA